MKGYYVTCLYSDSPPKVLQKLSNKYAKSLLSSNQILHRFEHFQRKKEETSLNLEDFERTVNRYIQMFINEKKHNIIIEFDYKRKAYVDINRAFINYLASFKSLIEHMEKFINTEYKGNNVVIDNFKNIKKKYYDNYFSYRLFYHLRNYSVHKSHPINSIQFDVVHDGKGGYNYNVNVNLVKSSLSESKTFSKSMKNDEEYKRLPNYIFLPPYLINFQSIIEAVFTDFISLTKDYFNNSSVLIQKISDKLSKNCSSIGITKFSNSKSILKHHSIVLPIDLNNDFQNEMKKI